MMTMYEYWREQLKNAKSAEEQDEILDRQELVKDACLDDEIDIFDWCEEHNVDAFAVNPDTGNVIIDEWADLCEEEPDDRSWIDVWD